MRRVALVLAKAPVPGLAKTRIAAEVGEQAAARLAAAALLDTLEAVERWAAPAERLVALTGDLSAAVSSAELSGRLRSWRVVDQRGHDFAARLVNAHLDAAAAFGCRCVVVQIGMDTPGIGPADLETLVRLVEGGDAPGVDCALGPALDGGWWGLAVRGAAHVKALTDVPTSRADTGRRTHAALLRSGASVGVAHVLRDMDHLADVVAIARAAPRTRLAAAWRDLAVEHPTLTRSLRLDEPEQASTMASAS